MKKKAKEILDAVLKAGFDQAQVKISKDELNELNVAHNAVSLMRSADNTTLDILAIKDNKKVSASISGTETSAVRDLIDSMNKTAKSTPADKAYAVSVGQRGDFSIGSLTVDKETMAASVKELLAYRQNKFSNFIMEEAVLDHHLTRSTILTSEGSEIQLERGFYKFQVLGSSKDQHGSSSFTNSGGFMNELSGALHQKFDIELIMSNSLLETKTEQIGPKFTGDVILMPNAAKSLLSWLQGQLSESSLMQGASLYKDSVGQTIASDKLEISHFINGPGVSPVNNEAFLLQPFKLIEAGKLNTLLPSYYGSRKLNLPHKPSGRGWEVKSGDVSRQDMVSSVGRGAIVNRLSMGTPAPNGDFSGVIKNSFLIEDGKKTKALSETMISGNVAQMLKNIVAISSESTDFGTTKMPWIRISGLHFS